MLLTGSKARAGEKPAKEHAPNRRSKPMPYSPRAVCAPTRAQGARTLTSAGSVAPPRAATSGWRPRFHCQCQRRRTSMLSKSATTAAPSSPTRPSRGPEPPPDTRRPSRSPLCPRLASAAARAPIYPGVGGEQHTKTQTQPAVSMGGTGFSQVLMRRAPPL